nr:MAG TPA: Nucleotide modification associated domain 1 [Caudoviricetes sp.]
MKVNPTNMKGAHNELLSIFEKKNSDYGNSFEESLEKHGIIAAIVRMEDKMGRLNSLTKKGAEQKVSDESLVDTLKDLSNYALMTAVWLEDDKTSSKTEQPPFVEWGKLSQDDINLGIAYV